MFLGDIIHVHCFGSPFIILNSYSSANELLEKRSSIYSDRPEMIMAGELYVFHPKASFDTTDA
jgi:hypothetical protein